MSARPAGLFLSGTATQRVGFEKLACVEPGNNVPPEQRLFNGTHFWFDTEMKNGTIHVFDFLAAKPSALPPGLCPLFGGDRFLQQLAIRHIASLSGNEDAGFTISMLDGNSCQWADAMDELSTRSLFDSDSMKFVVIDDADPFVKRYRDRLESFAETPAVQGVLFLAVSSWGSNTRLYRYLNDNGLQIHCDAPVAAKGRSKQRDDSRVAKWLIERARSVFGFTLSHNGATVLMELTECHFGRMEQELGKICLYAEQGKELSPAEIRKIVGGWPAQTMWSAIDAALEGRAGEAMNLLGQLFAAGEHPLAMFGQIAWSLRRYAEVGERVRRDSRQRKRIDLPATLKEAGFRTWGNELGAAQNRLRQLGRIRVDSILDWLVETDQALKRSHSREERGRLMLEMLFVKMASELGPARETA